MMLNDGIFHEDDLVLCYAPPNLLSVMPGNKVMLRSGGPMMIVTSTIGTDSAMCRWDENTEIFQLACLTCYGAS